MSPTEVMRFEPLLEGVLKRRWKRFLAEVELDDGQLVTAHCANTGPMIGVLHPGQRVRLRYDPSPKRKLAYTWEQAEVPAAAGGSCWAGVNTALPNKLLRATIESGLLEPWLGRLASIRATTRGAAGSDTSIQSAPSSEMRTIPVPARRSAVACMPGARSSWDTIRFSRSNGRLLT